VFISTADPEDEIARMPDKDGIAVGDVAKLSAQLVDVPLFGFQSWFSTAAKVLTINLVASYAVAGPGRDEEVQLLLDNYVFDVKSLLMHLEAMVQILTSIEPEKPRKIFPTLHAGFIDFVDVAGCYIATIDCVEAPTLAEIAPELRNMTDGLKGPRGDRAAMSAIMEKSCKLFTSLRRMASDISKEFVGHLVRCAATKYSALKTVANLKRALESRRPATAAADAAKRD